MSVVIGKSSYHGRQQVLHWLLNTAETQQQRHSKIKWNKEKRKTNSTENKITEARILGNEQWFFITAFKKRFQMEIVLESNPWNETIRPTAVICLLCPSFWTQQILPLLPYPSRLQELFSNCLAFGRATVVPSCGGSPHHFSHTMCHSLKKNYCYSWRETIKGAATLEQRYVKLLTAPNVDNLRFKSRTTFWDHSSK